MSSTFTSLRSVIGRALRLPPSARRTHVDATTTHPAGVPQIPLPEPPSVDVGLEPLGVDRLLSDNDELIGRIKICYGRDRAAFDAEVLTVVRQYASFVNALPATPDNFFSDVAGLFRLGLEVGFYSLQGSDSYIVSGRSTISTRRMLEPRWRYACFLAGLTVELHRTLNQLIVTDADGTAWSPYLGPLTPWLHEHGARRMFVRWLKDHPESRSTSLFALPHILPQPTMVYLSEGNSIVVPHMLACISGIPVPGPSNAITDVVRRASAAVLDRDMESNVRRFGRQIHGAHLERYLIDAMRRLVTSNPAWSPNSDRSRVWLGEEGLFVVWPNAADDVRKLLDDDELPGIPRSPDTIREILEAAGVLDPLPEGGGLWQILPPGVQQPLGAVRVSSPALLTLRDSRPSGAALPTLLKPAPTPTPPSPIAATVAKAPASSRSPPSPPTPPTPPVAASPSEVLATPRTDIALTPLSPSAASDPRTESGHATESPTAEPTPDPQDATNPVLSLDAPFTLDPDVRESLQRSMASMSLGDPSAGVIVCAGGLFFTIDGLKRDGLDVRSALRSIGASGMARADLAGTALTHTEKVGGRDHQGFLVGPPHIRGWSPPRT